MIGLLLTLLAIYFYGIEEKRYVSVFLIIGLSTAGFQLLPLELMVMPGIGISKSFDWPFLFFGFIVLFHPHVFLQKAIWLRYKWLVIFLIVLVFLLFYSVKFAGVEASVSIRVFRGYIYFLLLFPFARLKQDHFVKVIRLVVYMVTASSLLYCLQPLVNAPLLNAITNPLPVFHEEGGGSMTRFYNLPGLVFPVVFIVFFSKSTFHIRYRYLLSAINFGAILVSQNRSMILVFVLCFLLHQVFTGKLKPARMAAYAVIGMVAYTGVNTIIGSRFSEGFAELSKTSLSMTAAKVTTADVYDMSTSEYRWYHVVERTEYLLKDKWRALFGIGLITEDSKATNALRFILGAIDDTGIVPQVATGDIAWSVLFLHLGLGGTAIFIMMYTSFMRRFFVQRKSDIMKLALYYTLVLLLTSVYSISIFLPHHLCLFAFFIAYLFTYENKPVPIRKPLQSFRRPAFA